MDKMRSIQFSSKGHVVKLLHVEADGCIINIRVGLVDDQGRRVTAISISADGDRYSGDPQWWIPRKNGVDADERGVAVRIVQADRKRSKKGKQS